MVTASLSAICRGATPTSIGAPVPDNPTEELTKTSSKRCCGGASGHFSRIASRSAASPQHTIAGEQSFIMATSSAGACRAYSGTTIRPSAIIARSIAAQRRLLCANRAQRSPRFSPCLAIKARAALTNSRRSPPVTAAFWSSRSSCSTGAARCFSSWSKIFSMKFTESNSRGSDAHAQAHHPYASTSPLKFALSGGKYSSQFHSPLRVGNSGYRRCTSSSK